jgi:ribosomal protein L7/L12
MKIENRTNINGAIVTVVSLGKEKFVRTQTSRYNGIDMQPFIVWKKQRTNHLVNAKKKKTLEEQFKLIDTITKTVLDYTKTNFGPAFLPESGGTMYFAFDRKPYEKTKEELAADLKADSTILEYCQSGRLLEAVKFYKEYAGLGLKEAKDYVDSLREKNHAQLRKPLK